MQLTIAHKIIGNLLGMCVFMYVSNEARSVAFLGGEVRVCVGGGRGGGTRTS